MGVFEMKNFISDLIIRNITCYTVKYCKELYNYTEFLDYLGFVCVLMPPYGGFLAA